MNRLVLSVLIALTVVPLPIAGAESKSSLPSEAGVRLVLVPVLPGGIVGENGALWFSDIWVTNRTDGNLLRQDAVRLDPPTQEFWPIPAYFELRLPPQAIEERPIRLRIRPLTDGAHFWAFASATNNDTSEITIIRPW